MTEEIREYISKEVAEREFDRFAEAMDLELDTSLMDDDDLRNFMKAKNSSSSNHEQVVSH